MPIVVYSVEIDDFSSVFPLPFEVEIKNRILSLHLLLPAKLSGTLE